MNKIPIPIRRPIRTRPLVVAHRGFSSKGPENTLASYRLALELEGVDMAECDVYLSKDRVPILLHDEELDRTTTGRGKVGEFTLAELKKLDAGSWKGLEFKGEPIPTLQEALDLVKGRLHFVIEIKGPSMEKEVVEAIRAAGAPPEQVMIFSFDHGAVDRIARLEPLLPTTWLIEELPPEREPREEILRRALRARASSLGLSRKHVDQDFLRRAHLAGFTTYVWTANEPEEMQFLIEVGVDAIITDRPDVLLKLLA